MDAQFLILITRPLEVFHAQLYLFSNVKTLSEENCASVWSFFYAEMAENQANIDWGGSNAGTESEDIRQDLES
ncbi:hypothetical protein FRX31_013338 [Thalictrum thalictroides]|uniref:Uncharacterized protein n=1 Tax=Thalictrum thalictroides TaxID=46969 RepID=A0A7J6WKV5_THATH|nr:hypothetical protein FRX31_013338 [Thalictrum thalictroides]